MMRFHPFKFGAIPPNLWLNSGQELATGGRLRGPARGRDMQCVDGELAPVISHSWRRSL